MSLSSQITGMILEMLGSSGSIEIQRNELAQTIGCVPSQINYVIASRFTPEQGYIVESRRGGGGYIRIRRAAMEPNQKVMHAVNAVGDKLDERTARAHLAELVSTGVIDKHADAQRRVGQRSATCRRRGQGRRQSVGIQTTAAR